MERENAVEFITKYISSKKQIEFRYSEVLLYFKVLEVASMLKEPCPLQNVQRNPLPRLITQLPSRLGSGAQYTTTAMDFLFNKFRSRVINRGTKILDGSFPDFNLLDFRYCA